MDGRVDAKTITVPLPNSHLSVRIVIARLPPTVATSVALGLQRTHEYPQRNQVVNHREGPHGHDELHLRVLRLVDAQSFHLPYSTVNQKTDYDYYYCICILPNHRCKSYHHGR